MNVLPTKILLATDGSEEAELALGMAVGLANSTNSELHLFSVGGGPYRRYYHVRHPKLLEETLRELRRQAQETLEAQARMVEEAGGSVTGRHVAVGNPTKKILDQAEEVGAGLIVMGSRGLGGIRRALMGSVSDSVVRHAPCPVLVVRKGLRPDQSASTTTRAEGEVRKGDSKGMTEGRGERATGTPNTIYDLSSVLYHALQGGRSYDQYIRDAEAADDEELADFFGRVRDEDSTRADEAQRLLAARTRPTTGRVEETSPGQERAGQAERGREEERGLLDRAADALRGQDSLLAPRRREGSRGDEPL